MRPLARGGEEVEGVVAVLEQRPLPAVAALGDVVGIPGMTTRERRAIGVYPRQHGIPCPRLTLATTPAYFMAEAMADIRDLVKCHRNSVIPICNPYVVSLFDKIMKYSPHRSCVFIEDNWNTYSFSRSQSYERRPKRSIGYCLNLGDFEFPL